ncbi:MAG: P-II family nitrogen regulator [Actinobacteria bacterium]|nr:P-II family nitrogen regulator [Actinomycetota bacterium]
MKLIVAHVPNEAFEPVRAELIDLGVLRMTVSEVHSTSARSAIALRYRGAPLATYLRAELRIECVATETQSPAVIEVLRANAGCAGQIAVLGLEELHHQSSAEEAFSDDRRLDAAVH